MPYRVDFATNDVERQLKGIPRKIRDQLMDRMVQLGETPLPFGVKHLHDNVHRIRSGDYRIVYAVYHAEQLVVITKVAERGKVYRGI